MPHAKMQEYVNIDFQKGLSIVAELKNGKLIAEARFNCLHLQETHPEVAIFVDENYQNFGLASYLLSMLMRQAKEKKFKGFKAELLPDNAKVMRVIQKIDWEIELKVDNGVYNMIIHFK